MIKAVIFDGTLIDSVDSHATSWQDSFRRFGHEFDYEDIRSQIGKGGDQLMPVFLSEDEINRYGEQIEACRAFPRSPAFIKSGAYGRIDQQEHRHRPSFIREERRAEFL
jgi:phosphoglycolate phosphatase-like HAD superfamily hydrolase